MSEVIITSAENNIEVTFSEHLVTKQCNYGKAEFPCIRVEFKNLENKSEYTTIDDSEVEMILLSKDDLVRLKRLFQNQYKKAMKVHCKFCDLYANKKRIPLTLMEDDINLYLHVMHEEFFYLEIGTFIGNIIESVNIYAYEMNYAYSMIFNFLNKNNIK